MGLSPSSKASVQQGYLLEQSADAQSAVHMTVTNISSADLHTASNSLSQVGTIVLYSYRQYVGTDLTSFSSNV